MHISTISKGNIDKKVANLIPKSIAIKHSMVPIKKNNDNLVVAMVDPYNFIAIEDIKLYTNSKIETIRVESNDIDELIDLCYQIEEKLSGADSLPIAELIDDIIQEAIDMKASDIHIEPRKNHLEIRFRIHGDLISSRKLSMEHTSAIVSRIKVIGNMDIAEKRIAQDGRIETTINNNEVDIRLSTMPTIFGEKVVLRVLNKTNFDYEITNLGLNNRNLKIFKEIITQPYGMVLLTGPTGCGKSTTMYTILKEINTREKNIITVEDPVEYQVEGINQIQVNYKAGLDFASGLRSILRQDPDYIFIGEIRDQETSRLAVRAAITGHLLFSTLHTNDSVSTIHRLLDMGIEPYLLSSSLIGIISQRLVKLLCPYCKEDYQASDNQKKIIEIDLSEKVYFYKARGCNHCMNGYQGRTAIYEVLKIDNNIRSLIDDSSKINRIKKSALESGMITLFQSAKELLIAGKIPYEECLKIKTV